MIPLPWCLATALAASGPSHILANTETVEDVAVAGSDLWVASQGGIEHYDLTTHRRLRHYTTRDGLPSLHVLALDIGDTVFAQTAHHDCRMSEDRFTCSPRDTPLHKPLMVAPSAHGRRVTATATHAGAPVVGTAGAGVWHGSTRLTPAGQPCTNFAAALLEHDGALWIGAFDGGLCHSDDGLTFAAVPGAPRMVNDLLSTPQGLFVASSEGLHHSRDGKHFIAITASAKGPVNGLAWDGRRVFASSPARLWRFDPKTGRQRNWWMPGSSRALQDVAIGTDGTLWLAAEDRGAIAMNGNTFTIYDRAAGLPTSWGLKIAVADDGTVMLATLRDGVVRVAPDAPDGEAKPIPVPDSWTLAVHPEGGGLWVGTQDGAAFIDMKGDMKRLQGLPEANVHAFARYHGELYVGTEGGIAVYGSDDVP